MPGTPVGWDMGDPSLLWGRTWGAQMLGSPVGSLGGGPDAWVSWGGGMSHLGDVGVQMPVSLGRGECGGPVCLGRVSPHHFSPPNSSRRCRAWTKRPPTAAPSPSCPLPPPHNPPHPTAPTLWAEEGGPRRREGVGGAEEAGGRPPALLPRTPPTATARGPGLAPVLVPAPRARRGSSSGAA